ncbi:hypothetical protein XELAEV_18008672mg [Xenopus laevis]|uniref:Nucleolar protein 5A n=1 Tax=Xenopus laevis TaxID=8355 RepID=A0A974DS49_XENLA|nr:hypothetical protein XELAEV_18008672mg [Xenopus laevis]
MMELFFVNSIFMRCVYVEMLCLSKAPRRPDPTLPCLSRSTRVNPSSHFPEIPTSVFGGQAEEQVEERVLHEDLKLLLETHMPAKKNMALLGVADVKIGAAIQEELKITCQTGGVVAEILRGIRLHFHSLVKGLTAQSASKAQLGLGHSYSCAKVKININRVDNMIIQSISLLDQLDKDINTFSMRVREWYRCHLPELIKIVSDNYTYCHMAMFIGNRKELSEEKLEEMVEIVMDSAKAQAVLDASHSSMGMDISPIDLIIESFSSRVISLWEYHKELQEYLRSKMSHVAPSLSALIGEVPASTVQILGAEKVLDQLHYRALKTRGNTPKYGLIFHSTFIGRADKSPPVYLGDKLREQVEERLFFYETGEAPRKNLDVMKETAGVVLGQLGAGDAKAAQLTHRYSALSDPQATEVVSENKRKRRRKKRRSHRRRKAERMERRRRKSQRRRNAILRLRSLRTGWKRKLSPRRKSKTWSQKRRLRNPKRKSKVETELKLGVIRS